ncbi:MAG: trimethylamine methyltransferase family protein [Candidatus Bathyarchaeota archaeon]|nr:MAG: trimethylamine methyltransferase family protein [Candidatus Bathyarchaeota archaeon]
MNVQNISRGGQYKVLSSDELYDIHLASLEVLEKVGIGVNDAQALQKFEDHGATVDYKLKRAWIPQYMVMDAVRKAPRSVTLCAKDRVYDIKLEDRRVHFGTGGNALYVLDKNTGARRKAVVDDLKNLALLTNSLDNVQFFQIPVHPSDVPNEVKGLNRYRAALCYCIKPVYGGVYTLNEVEGVIRMATTIAGGDDELRKRPLMGFVTCSTAPLSWDTIYVRVLAEAASRAIPVIISTEPLAGGTGPTTLAGTVVVQNAEALSGVVLTQLVNPGTPVIYGTVATIMDPKSGNYVAGAVEMGLLNVAGAQLAQYYELPIYATGGMTDSKVIDVQAGYEKAITSLMAGLAGANLVHNAAGFLESALTYSYEQMVIDDEILGMVNRALRGIEVNDETLAVNVINDIGPGGHFLAHPHTLTHIGSEFFLPNISDRARREGWEKTGAKDAWQRSRERTRALLKTAKQNIIDTDIKAEVDKIFKEEVQRILKKNL